MTNIILNENDLGFWFSAKGHAEKRKDEDVNLCCAGESMLMQAALKAAGKMAEEGKLVRFNYSKAPGNFCLSVRCHNCDAWVGEMTGIKEMLKSGFELLEERYPDQIIRGENAKKD